MSFLGPEGVADRMAQIQRRLDTLAPRQPSSLVADAGFGKTMDAAMTEPLDLKGLQVNPLRGPIGAGGSDLRAMAADAAARHNVDPQLFAALVDQESSWDPTSTSRVGAKGLCQLMDGTAREMGVSDPYDPAQSLDGGARYLRRMLDMNGGDPARALASYNAGFGRVNGRGPGEWPAETRHYVSRIMARAGGGAA